MSPQEVSDAINAHMDVALKVIEKRYGKELAASAERMLDLVIDCAIVECAQSNLHPGQLMVVFMELVRALDQSSDKIAVHHISKN